jgi:hypothetical protein
MGTDPRKRQKKLERRAAKRKQKKQSLVRAQDVGIGRRLTAAAKFPVLHCWISDTVQTEGIGWVVLSRELPGSRVAIAVFLVDRYCLGVKDAFGQVLDRSDYDRRFRRKMALDRPCHNIPPAEARKFVEAAVAYARGLGLPPHPDYAKAMLLFGDIDPAQSNAQFEFGKDGKPFFVSGPYDTPERCRQILATLTNTCGPGNFEYLVMASPHQEMRILGPDEEIGDELEDWDEDEE